MKNLYRLSGPQNHRCCYCTHRMIRHRHQPGVSMPPNAITREHFIPRTHGGKNGSNLIAACSQCNTIRGDMDAYAFYTRLQRIFERNPCFHTNWHQLTKDELSVVRRALLDTHERQLRGLGIKSLEHAWRHMQLMRLYGHELRA